MKSSSVSDEASVSPV